MKKKSGMILVSIVIANKDGEKFLEGCLSSILVEKGSYEVIVVDDGSDPPAVLPTSAKRAGVRIIRQDKSVGAAEARNIGAASSRGKYLFFLDVDTKLHSGWYKEVLVFFKRYIKTGAAQVKLLTMGTNKFDSAGEYMGPFGFLVERARMSRDKGQFDDETFIFSGKSAGMIIRCSVFESLGGFDRDYQIFLEDTDLFWRVWLSGHEVRFCPKVVVEHAYMTKKKSFNHYIENKVFYRGARNTIMNLVKNLGSKRVWWVVPVNVMCWSVLGVVFFLKLDFKRSWAMFSGIGWNVLNFLKVLKKRNLVQTKRKISDEELFLGVGIRQGLGYYLGKAKAYLTGKPF